MSLQCDNLSGELQDQWSSSFSVGIQLAEISTMPQSVITDAKKLAEKISEEKKVIAIFQAMKITSENRTCKS